MSLEEGDGCQGHRGMAAGVTEGQMPGSEKGGHRGQRGIDARVREGWTLGSEGADARVREGRMLGTGRETPVVSRRQKAEVGVMT